MEEGLLIVKRSCQFQTQALTNRKEINDLDDEILVEILSKLPRSKSVAKCKCVCKRWLCLLSDNYFTLRFRQQHRDYVSFSLMFPSPSRNGITLNPNNLSSLKSNRLITLFYFKNKTIKKEASIHVLAIYRDLVLTCHDNDHVSYYVCQPHSRRTVSLPPSPNLFDRKVVSIGFVCDYDYEKDDDLFNCSRKIKIKVVRLLLTSHSYYKVNIFSSDIGVWTELNPNPNLNPLNPIPISIPIPHSVTCNGTIFLRDHMTRRLIGFNVVDYQFHIIDLPPFPFIDQIGIKDMGVCRGQLRICQWTGTDHNLSDICIWELETIKPPNRWSLVHKLYFKDLFSAVSIASFNLLDRRLLQVVDFHPHDGDVVHFHMHPNCIYSCNFRNKTYGRLLDPKTIFSFNGWKRRAAYFIDHPLWPTPLPPTLHSNCNSNSNHLKVLQRRTRRRKMVSQVVNQKVIEE